MSNDHIQESFDQVCKDAKKPTGWYVSLMVDVPYYGGPEEGGWWGHDTRIVAYQYFATEEEANTAYQAVQKLAKELETEARRNYGRQCQKEMDWLDKRGLDADFLPEPDGPEKYYVLLTEGLPQETTGIRHYE